MPTDHTIAAARTALETLKALRANMGKTAEIKALNAAIDVAVEVAKRTLQEDEPPARRPEQVARRFGER